MKKALIVTALAGFARSFLFNDMRILQNMGYEVHCAANKIHPGADNIEDYFADIGVIFHQIGFSSSDPLSHETLTALRQFRKLVQGIHFELVHCHTPIAGAVCRWACRKQRNQGIKILYTTHGFYFHRTSGKKAWWIYRTIEDWMSRYSDAIITINHEDYENAKKMQCKSVHYLPGIGVDTVRFGAVRIDRKAYREELGIMEDAFLVLAIGELSVRKNHQVVIRALKELRLPNAVFMLCGNAMTGAATTDLLKALAKECNVDLRLMGLRKDIPEICECADVGVLPSTREGLGVAAIEMLASGLPVVASNVQGIVDYIVDGANGYLCDPYDVHAFAEGIRKLADEKSRQLMRATCIETAKAFDRVHSNQKMIEIYQELRI